MKRAQIGRLIFTRKERWGLSFFGWLLLASGMWLTTGLIFLKIQPFLATTRRVDAQVLVVEGWVHAYSIRAAVAEFTNGGYQTIFTTGGPVVGTGGYSNDFNTAAGVGAAALRAEGIAGSVIQMVPSHITGRDRTYSSALALREWLQRHHQVVLRVNILTEGAHARRTRWLFQKALGPDVSVGIISIADPDYDAAHWWRYSEGVREVVGESIAYIYARTFFQPQPDSTATLK